MASHVEKSFRVAVVQSGALLMNGAGTLQKALGRIAEAAAQGAQLVLFPEAFIGGYPRGLGFGTVVGDRSAEGRALFARYHAGAIVVPGEETAALAGAAREAGAYLVIGVVERDARHPRGTLYCSLLYFSPEGKLVHKHRKLKPTAAERLIWGEGDGMDLQVVETPFGKIGGLICWENYMPLARWALYRQGIDLYLAPTADSRERWQASLRHLACEGRCFVLGCNQFVTREMYPPELRDMPEIAALGDPLCRGGSAILDPLGNYLAGPLYDEERMLFAELDPGQIPAARFDFDAAGHYARPDLIEKFQRAGWL